MKVFGACKQVGKAVHTRESHLLVIQVLACSGENPVRRMLTGDHDKASAPVQQRLGKGILITGNDRVKVRPIVCVWIWVLEMHVDGVVSHLSARPDTTAVGRGRRVVWYLVDVPRDMDHARLMVVRDAVNLVHGAEIDGLAIGKVTRTQELGGISHHDMMRRRHIRQKDRALDELKSLRQALCTHFPQHAQCWRRRRCTAFEHDRRRVRVHGYCIGVLMPGRGEFPCMGQVTCRERQTGRRRHGPPFDGVLVSPLEENVLPTQEEGVLARVRCVWAHRQSSWRIRRPFGLRHIRFVIQLRRVSYDVRCGSRAVLDQCRCTFCVGRTQDSVEDTRCVAGRRRLPARDFGGSLPG